MPEEGYTLDGLRIGQTFWLTGEDSYDGGVLISLST
jgi:hypothetical protein